MMIFLIALSSFIGFSIPFMINILISIGSASTSTVAPPFAFFLLSIFHGLFELIALYYIYIYTINLLYSYINIYKNNDTRQTKLIIKKFYYIFLWKITFLLLIGAVIEVLVSNRLIYFLYG